MGKNVVSFDALDGAFQQTIVDQNAIPGMDFFVQVTVINRYFLDPIMHATDQLIGAQYQGFARSDIQPIAFQLA